MQEKSEKTVFFFIEQIRRAFEKSGTWIKTVVQKAISANNERMQVIQDSIETFFEVVRETFENLFSMFRG